MADQLSDSDSIRELVAEARAAHAAATVTLAKARELAVRSKIELDEDDVITAQRINIVESDGTLRLAISSRDRFPGIVMRGEETPHPDRGDMAGLIFYSDEATEDGGLIWNGSRTEDGYTSAVHLSFDNYEQDQSLVLEAEDRGPDRRTQMIDFVDRPDWSMADLVKLDPASVDEFLADKTVPTRRMRLAREEDASVGLTLADRSGRPRIVLRVGADGESTIRVLDQDGAVVAQLPPPVQSSVPDNAARTARS